MAHRDIVRLVQELSGDDEVEFVEIPPQETFYGEQVLHPQRMIRRGQRYLVEMTEYPGEWWLGEFHGSTLKVRGSYGSLSETVDVH